MNTITSRIFISAATVLWAASVQGAAPKGPQSCVVERLQIETEIAATPTSINKNGDIAGTVGNTRDPYGNGFFLRNGETTFLPPNTLVNDINATGMLVGNTWDLGAPEGSMDNAFKWANGQFTILPKLRAGGMNKAFANAINANGLIVGECQARACYWEGDHREAVSLDGFYQSSARAVNDTGVIVGVGQDPSYSSLCAKWVDGKPYVLPSGNSVSCIATSINNRGEIAGQVTENGFDWRAVMWRGDVMSYLGGDPDHDLRVRDISESGVVVGTGGLLPEAFYWRNGKQHSFNDLPCVQQSGWELESAFSISPAGIVGYGSKGPYRLRRAFNE